MHEDSTLIHAVIRFSTLLFGIVFNCWELYDAYLTINFEGKLYKPNASAFIHKGIQNGKKIEIEKKTLKTPLRMEHETLKKMEKNKAK